MKKLVSLSIMMCALIWATLPSSLHALTPSFDAVSYKPATDHGFYLTSQGSQTLGKGKFHGGMSFVFSQSSLILVNAAGNKVRDVIGKQFSAHAAVAVGVTDWLNLGALINFVPYQQFTGPATGISDNGARMGDIRIDAKFRLLDRADYPVGIAIVPFLTFPSGNGSHFTGEGQVTGGGELVIESKRIADRFSVTANVGGIIRDDQQLSSGTNIADQLTYAVGANFAVIPEVELIAEMRGWTQFDDFFGSQHRPMIARGAVRAFPIPEVAITAGGGAAVLKGMGAPTYETFLTVAYTPAYDHYEPVPPVACPDADSDGVCDLDDRCPAEAGPSSNCGCPPAPLIEIDEDANEIRNQKIHFDFNKSTIKENSYAILDTIAASLKARPDITHVRIIGHTDSIGSNQYNQKLSERRASAVRDYLHDKGVKPERMSHFGKGETEPIASNATAAGRAKNRRVQFDIDVLPREAKSTCKR